MSMSFTCHCSVSGAMTDWMTPFYFLLDSSECCSIENNFSKYGSLKPQSFKCDWKLIMAIVNSHNIMTHFSPVTFGAQKQQILQSN